MKRMGANGNKLLSVLIIILGSCLGATGEQGRVVSRREVETSDGPSQIRLHLHHAIRPFQITAHDTGLLDAAILGSVDGDGVHKTFNVDTHRWFTGRLDDDPGSHVRLTVTNSSFYGNIHTSDGHTYVVNGDEEILELDHAETPAHHHCETNTVPKFLNGSASLTRSKRSPPKSSVHTHCEIFLDADRLFYEYWGGEGTEEKRISSTIIKMIDVIYQVDGIYHLARNLDGNVALQIVGTKVHTSRTFTAQPRAASGSAMLEAYQEWLAEFAAVPNESIRGEGLPLFDEVCLNHLFTHQNLGGVLGVAIQASPRVDTVGGVCETHTVDASALNVGFTNTVTADDGVVPSWQSSLSTAHEIGHNLGASHDCELRTVNDGDKGLCSDVQGSSICVPSAERGGSFLMFPAVDIRNDHVNSQLFSPCSLAQIYDVVQAKGSCLVKPTLCDNGGSCCVGTSVLPEGTSCRAAPASEPCLRSAVCTGLSPGCPAFRTVPDETPCKHPDTGVHGVCYDGACVHNHDQFCSQHGLNGCTIKGHDCVRACQKAGSEVCAAFEKVCQLQTPGTNLVQWWSETSSTCPTAMIGSPCTTVVSGDGQCTDEGTCKACGAPDCATDIELIDDTVTVQCQYEVDFRASCSEPCGGGTQTVLYACFCGTARDISGTRCGTSKSASAAQLCNQQPCSTSAPQELQVVVTMSPDDFDPDVFASTVQDGLLLPLEVARYSRSEQPTDTDVYVVSCRQARDACLLSSELKSLLQDPAAKDRIAQNGFEYKFKEEASNTVLSTEVVIVIIASIIIAGVIIGITLFCLSKQAKSGDTDINGQVYPAFPKDTKKVFRVLYNYEKRNPDELELLVGMVVTVLGESKDPGWWIGRNGSDVGVFPSTFVEEVPNVSCIQQVGAPSEASHCTEV